ncbi:uncharacterized protein LOC103360850 isoform X2 [Stegastes partitus]|uniref:Uncharacterized protein LOC103360850 isoform X2 n=1 Tax=Stegastes partitus TaxID=144197 RepID=A0A9Y4N305_9TELE|nr:PREDICTED: uncharacterized protein LOC103360850 isoform X2 [Stegastes partitus]
MGKVLLLVLLCLQVVLLTTAFTAAHEAALLRDDQDQLQQLSDLIRSLQQVNETEGAESKIRVRRFCGRKRGGCSSFRRPPPTLPSLIKIKSEPEKPSGVKLCRRGDQCELQQPADRRSPLQQVKETEGAELKIRVRRQCATKPGGCGPLKVFLLITAFTCTDAATLVTEDQQQQSQNVLEGITEDDREKTGEIAKRRASHCSWRPGACSLISRMATERPQLTGPKIQ